MTGGRDDGKQTMLSPEEELTQIHLYYFEKEPKSMKTYEISDLIGSTPLVRLKNYLANRSLEVTVLAKV